MGRVLRAEALPPADLLVPLLMAGGLTALCLSYVASTLRRAAAR